MKYTKAIAKKMRELASQAYERELRRELEKKEAAHEPVTIIEEDPV